MPFASVSQSSTWVLIVLAVALAISVVAFVWAVRQSRQAPYFLWREEAAKRARRLFLLMVLIVAGGAAVLWLGRPEDAAGPQTAPPAPTPSATSTPANGKAAPSPASPSPTPSFTPLPTATLTPTATPALRSPPPGTPGEPRLEFLTFARGVTNDNAPLEPADEFAPTSEPIYGFFTYADMADGAPWSYVWLKDSVELARETRAWEWGRYGQAYLFFAPPGGYQEGRYRLRVFLEGHLQFVACFTIKCRPAASVDWNWRQNVGRLAPFGASRPPAQKKEEEELYP